MSYRSQGSVSVHTSCSWASTASSLKFRVTRGPCRVFFFRRNVGASVSGLSGRSSITMSESSKEPSSEVWDELDESTVLFPGDELTRIKSSLSPCRVSIHLKICFAFSAISGFSASSAVIMNWSRFFQDSGIPAMLPSGFTFPEKLCDTCNQTYNGQRSDNNGLDIKII